MVRIDEPLFEDHFRKHFQALCRYAYTFVKDGEQSREIVQEVFSTIWEKRNTLMITETLGVYLYRMVKNRSLNHLRDYPLHKFVANIPDVPAEEDDAQVRPSVDVRKILNILPERCREIFVLKRLEGLSYKQISDRLNISEKSVENQMTIAFRKLREEIKSNENLLGETD